MIDKKIKKRLAFLTQCVKEEGGKIDEDSLRAFHNFIHLNNLPYPEISLTDDNTVYASWDDFSMHFTKGNTRFVSTKLKLSITI